MNSYREQKYLSAFCNDFLSAAPGYLLACSSWSRMVLQEALNEVSLRQAVTALSALILANENDAGRRSTSPSCSTTSAVDVQNHRDSAVVLHHKALGGMHKIQSPRAALLAHLAMFTYEKLNGRSDLAVTYIQRGLKLLRELSTSNLQTGSWGKRASDLTSPVLYIEDDIARVFVGLEIQLIPFGRSQPLPCQKEFYQNISPMREGIPSDGFTSLRAARESLERIMARGIDGQSFGYPRRRMSSNPLFEGRGPGPDLQPFVSSDFSSIASIEQCYTEIDAWLAAFVPLFVASESKKEGDDYINAICLEIQAKTTKILLARTLFSTETQFDSLLAYFRRIIDLCEIHISHPYTERPSARSIMSISGIILPLLLTAVRCRDSNVRHRAVKLLQGLNRMEGVLSSDAFAQIAAWVVNLEEENGVHPGIRIPEEQRVRMSKVKINFPAKAVEATCEKASGEDGHTEMSILVRW
ncbi:C6 zinc finger domain protein [Phlyctema vagabunda]|uniref:C6 zinc finger domain protein n=1 Tax=Phlyctema vagabunda TaxID=108571 RepID=A0ABR4PPU7_9HELO